VTGRVGIHSLFTSLCIYFLVVYGRCLPGHIDPNAQALQTVLNKNAAELEEMVVGQSNIDILNRTEEVQFHVVTVCVFVCLFVCMYVLCFYFN